MRKILAFIALPLFLACTGDKVANDLAVGSNAQPNALPERANVIYLGDVRVSTDTHWIVANHNPDQEWGWMVEFFPPPPDGNIAESLKSRIVYVMVNTSKETGNEVLKKLTDEVTQLREEQSGWAVGYTTTQVAPKRVAMILQAQREIPGSRVLLVRWGFKTNEIGSAPTDDEVKTLIGFTENAKWPR
ncbi:MAG: hypothetical protein JXB13_06285 [Phycisphaerae bacterium]|nr:hypothetical protein [Phycisphaerae bacterium]